MKKKGFTLVEILVVIGIIALLTVLVLPNVIGSYNKSLREKMAIEEANTIDAAELYLEDHCISPLAGYTCPNTYSKKDKKGFICINELRNPTHGDSENDFYIEENSISYSNKLCTGLVKIDGYDMKTYLYCNYIESKNKYDYITDSTFELTDDMKTNCGID